MSTHRRSQKHSIGIVAGIATPIVAFISILTAIATYPQFSWTDNALSDLGVVAGVTGPLFNFGLVSAGILGFIFASLGLFIYFEKSQIGKIGSTVFAAATIALICIGIFNENYSPTHYIVSVAFFMLSPIALFILTGAFYRNNQRRIAVFTVSIGVTAAIPWILEFTIRYVPNVAIPETISALAVSIWAIALARIMLKPKQPVKTDKTPVNNHASKLLSRRS